MIKNSDQIELKSIAAEFEGHVIELAKNKYGSNVLQTFVQYKYI